MAGGVCRARNGHEAENNGSVTIKAARGAKQFDGKERRTCRYGDAVRAVSALRAPSDPARNWVYRTVPENVPILICFGEKPDEVSYKMAPYMT